MAWRQTSLLNRNLLSLLPSNSNTFFSGYSSKSNPYHVKVGIPEFLNGIGNGVETYAEKLESEFGDLQNLLVARSMQLKKLNVGGDPKVCKHSDEEHLRARKSYTSLASFKGAIVRSISFEGRKRKLILKYAHKYRLGLWRPRVEPSKTSK